MKTMPKAHHRYQHTIGGRSPCSGPIPSETSNDGSLPFSSSPRKVSFEDNRSDSKSSICSDDTVLMENNKGKQISEGTESGREQLPSTRRKRSLLVRPITSLSLVDLARSMVEEDDGSMTSGQDGTDRLEERKSKRIRSFSLSPRSVISNSDISNAHQDHRLWSPSASVVEESESIKKSPWGHFIDMVPNEDSNYRTSTHPNFSNMLKSYRRIPSQNLMGGLQHRSLRRSIPYCESEDYRPRRTQHATPSFIGLKTDSHLVNIMSETKNNFRLTPRSPNTKGKQQADRLIGVFSDLQL